MFDKKICQTLVSVGSAALIVKYFVTWSTRAAFPTLVTLCRRQVCTGQRDSVVACVPASSPTALRVSQSRSPHRRSLTFASPRMRVMNKQKKNFRLSAPKRRLCTPTYVVLFAIKVPHSPPAPGPRSSLQRHAESAIDANRFLQCLLTSKSATAAVRSRERRFYFLSVVGMGTSMLRIAGKNETKKDNENRKEKRMVVEKNTRLFHFFSFFSRFSPSRFRSTCTSNTRTHDGGDGC